ncbi:cytochrome c [Verticiella sediminum]|uniref:Cytochrome c n=1 Tax=Verticiella sediminum TaxID=1247510 RepID=A0A556B205_9BURK|nr:cytochrome c [Verticiella sediminum]TSH99192.1 cytochrome c [Verticiella sediminum]
MRTLCLPLLVVACSLAASAAAQAATLAVQAGAGQRTVSTEELLARPDAQAVEIPADVAYKRDMRYRAVPIAALLEGVAPEATLQAVALDGFVADLAAAPLLATDPAGARAWLAIEPPGQPWPALGEGKPSAGPFYLVWTNPAAGGIVPEQWPYQMAALRLVAPAAERFPAMQPQAGTSEDSPVWRGFQVFRTHCMVCHTLNGQGDASMGPDLNQPHSPTEYMIADALRMYLRDPQALRHWPQARMPAFDENILPQADLDALLAYLGHMAQSRGQGGADTR